jgi:Protein tyrosine and serine/threonine kinase
VSSLLLIGFDFSVIFFSFCDAHTTTTISTGITMWETYSRSTPYKGENPRKVLRLVCDPRVSKRPNMHSIGAPPKMVEIMTKCWSHDVGFRPTAKDLDLMFTDMNPIDAEPIMIVDELTSKLKRTQKVEGDMLYRVFPKKVADKLKVGQRVEA